MLTDQQIEQRRSGIGGSDVAGILGISKFNTAVEIYLQKVEGKRKNIENEFVYLGNKLEPVIRDIYQEKTGKKVFVDDELKVHPTNDFMIGNVDGVIEDGGILECKNCSIFKINEWGEQGTSEMPDYYLTQCMHYRIITNAPYVDLAVLLGGNQFRIYTYRENEVLEAELIAREKEFWYNHVLTRTPPGPSNIKDFNLLYPYDNSDSTDADEATREAIRDYIKTKDYLKEIEEQVEYYKQQIIFAFKNYSALCTNNRELATYKSISQNRLDSKSLEKEHPEIYSKFLKKNSFRVLKVKGA